jgi:sarcosine oxidase subunit beta
MIYREAAVNNKVYDAIVIGAGSVGTPSAMYLAEQGMKVLCLDQFASPGQGSNKCALGGIRATHSTPAKIKLCLDSLKVFSTWEQNYGYDIEWYQGGYTFVAYRSQEETLLKKTLVIQKQAGLNIDWKDKKDLLRACPGLREEGLIGGTYSPEDGCASPMRSCLGFAKRAVELGVDFHFNEQVANIISHQGKVIGVRTNKGDYATNCIINAAGSSAQEIAKTAGLDVQVVSDSHEGGITEPVVNFLDPMVVDIRHGGSSANFYFYQNKAGQVIFCYTPSPIILGLDTRETSAFLPLISGRMIGLMPKLGNLKVRRTWRGLYPMTPDGSPVVGRSSELDGYINAIGMCGQGYMLGPGVGALVARIATNQLIETDAAILEELSATRDFGGVEALK